MKKLIFCGTFLALVVSLQAQEVSPMVRETNPPPVPAGTIVINDQPTIILNNYNNEEILVVVEDIMGNDIYSKIVFKNQIAVLKAEDPYNKIPSGVYTVIACSRNEVYNQKIVID